MLPICECMTFDEFISDVWIMQLWCDDIIILFWINYGDVGFMPILMSDDDVCVVLFDYRVTYIALATRDFMPSDDGLYAKCS